jgi:hypothetical protein
MRHFAPDGAPFRLSMGLRRLDPAQWIEVDDDYGADLALKSDLLRQRRDDVVRVLPEGLAGSAEVRRMLADHLASCHPSLAVPDYGSAAGGEQFPAANRADHCATEHPLVAGALTVQEDLCVMHRRADSWVLAAAVVCFPSRWSLAQKVGQDITAIHGPVPGYRAKIAAATERFFDRLSVDRPMWRLNWTILDDPALFQPAGSRVPRDVAPADLTVRVERQTMRLLPVSGDVLFTIRTYRGRLGRVLARRQGTAADLAATLRTVSADYAAYRGWTDMLPGLLEWLGAFDSRQDGAPPGAGQGTEDRNGL